MRYPLRNPAKSKYCTAFTLSSERFQAKALFLRKYKKTGNSEWALNYKKCKVLCKDQLKKGHDDLVQSIQTSLKHNPTKLWIFLKTQTDEKSGHPINI